MLLFRPSWLQFPHLGSARLAISSLLRQRQLLPEGLLYPLQHFFKSTVCLPWCYRYFSHAVYSSINFQQVIIIDACSTSRISDSTTAVTAAAP